MVSENDTYDASGEDYDESEIEKEAPKKSYTVEEIEKILRSISEEDSKPKKERKEMAFSIARPTSPAATNKPVQTTFKKLPKVSLQSQTASKDVNEKALVWSIGAVSTAIVVLIFILVYLLVS